MAWEFEAKSTNGSASSRASKWMTPAPWLFYHASVSCPSSRAASCRQRSSCFTFRSTDKRSCCSPFQSVCNTDHLTAVRSESQLGPENSWLCRCWEWCSSAWWCGRSSWSASASSTSAPDKPLQFSCWSLPQTGGAWRSGGWSMTSGMWLVKLSVCTHLLP